MEKVFVILFTVLSMVVLLLEKSSVFEILIVGILYLIFIELYTKNRDGK